MSSGLLGHRWPRGAIVALAGGDGLVGDNFAAQSLKESTHHLGQALAVGATVVHNGQLAHAELVVDIVGSELALISSWKATRL